MPFVKRDEYGMVIAVSEEWGVECNEELAAADAQIAKFMTRVSGEPSPFEASDQHLVRVLEDVVELLIAKGLILFTELPVDAQQKIILRQKMRSEASSLQDLISND